MVVDFEEAYVAVPGFDGTRQDSLFSAGFGGFGRAFDDGDAVELRVDAEHALEDVVGREVRGERPIRDFALFFVVAGNVIGLVPRFEAGFRVVRFVGFEAAQGFCFCGVLRPEFVDHAANVPFDGSACAEHGPGGDHVRVGGISQ